MNSNKPGCKYAEIKPLMRSFDLLLFRGTDFVSRIINSVEKLQDGQAGYTHVGVVMLGKDLWPPANEEESKWLREDAVYVFESTMSGDLADGCKDVHGEAHLGVQLRVLDDVGAHYDKPEASRMAWCPPRQPVVDDATRRCRSMYERYQGLSYDLSAVDLAACAFKSMRRLRDNTAFSHIRDVVCRFIYGKKRADGATGDDNVVSKWQFCSEMACNIYKDIGLFPEAVNASNVMPVDFIPNATETATIDRDKEVPLAFTKPILFHS